MGKSNIAVKQWLRNKKRFADLFNGTIFQGDQIVLTEEEFLSKFRKEDKICPVISLVLYYGLAPWDASVDLYGMFMQNDLFEKSEILKKYVSNYRLNLIDAGNIENIQKFQSDLQLIFGMLRYKEEKDELHRYMNANGAYFKNVDQETYQAIRELLHSEKELKEMVSSGEGKGHVNMCKALEDLYNSGVNVGIEQGIEQGIERGIETKLLEQIEKKLAKGKSVEQIAQELEETIDRICDLMALL